MIASMAASTVSRARASVNSLVMSAPGVVDGVTPARGRVFRYEGFVSDAVQGLLTCRYSLDGREFTERITLEPGPRWNTPAAQAAARLIFLLAGVSYYKTAAPPVIDLGTTPLTDAERAFLRDFYLQGLGEYAYKNALDLSDLDIQAAPAPATSPTPATRPPLPPRPPRHLARPCHPARLPPSTRHSPTPATRPHTVP